VQPECSTPLLFLGTNQPELHAEVSLLLSNFPGCHLILGAGIITNTKINFHRQCPKRKMWPYDSSKKKISNVSKFTFEYNMQCYIS
jgi:hypothetical protein